MGLHTVNGIDRVNYSAVYLLSVSSAWTSTPPAGSPHSRLERRKRRNFLNITSANKVMVSSALVCLFVSLFVSRITQKLLLNRFPQNSSVVVKIFF